MAEGTNGYKADVLHGIWAQAPYLHNGSVPTLGQLMCPSTRPVRFLRGNLFYDEALVGFEWLDQPGARYTPGESMLVKEYDTTVPGQGQYRATRSVPPSAPIRPASILSPTARRSRLGSSNHASARCSHT